ncbi:hypothetical protein F5984_11655 [Rudanella paleaurantiibacter]|uniref:Uncharacterized protein n=1 Tax=Rudanella paleaurantiibacter TaxID=2614655 RepID=A0A7J5U110_9BACT|nr:hypothetical protein [Rudanella paleaurantiibacter]KAB7731436.1 hypothetical protein F5984_11655 [Rudanella paleaurantiibacter]
MNSLLLRKCGTLLIVCSTMLISPSCRNESDLAPVQSITEEQMVLLVEKVATSSAYKALFSEMANMSELVKQKQLVVNQVNVVDFENRLASSRTVRELEANLGEKFSKPSLVIGATEKLNVLLKRLDAETRFSTLSTEKRKELMKRVSEHSASKVAFTQAFKANAAQARVHDCGGDCNTVYYHTLEYAGYAAIAGTIVSYGAGLLGGPAGMAAGALGIAGVAAAYLIAEDAALTTLGDCFSACPD